MNDIVTKENWTSDPDNAPLPSDFIRIESNIRKVEENRQEETDARIADVDSEEARAIAAEAAAKEAALSSVSSAFGIGSYTFGYVFGGASYYSYGDTVTLSSPTPQINLVVPYTGPSGTGTALGMPGVLTSGTWRCMTFQPDLNHSALWVRIS